MKPQSFTTSLINAINHGSVKFNWHIIYPENVAQLMYKVYTLWWYTPYDVVDISKLKIPIQMWWTLKRLQRDRNQVLLASII
jgi:hypothetical protein